MNYRKTAELKSQNFDFLQSLCDTWRDILPIDPVPRLETAQNLKKPLQPASDEPGPGPSSARLEQPAVLGAP